MNKVTRYWAYEEATKIVSHEGTLKDNGDFVFNGFFGDTTRRKGYHFATKNEVILDKIHDIDLDIAALTNEKQWLLGQMESN